MHRKSGPIPNLLLAILLLTAQFGSLAHAYEHEPGAPQGKVCSTCATANQLSSACVDDRGDDSLAPRGRYDLAEHEPGSAGTRPVSVHQRGPPLPL